MTPQGLRDLAFESMWTMMAAATVSVDPERLIAFAEQRAGDGPVRDMATRDFGREVIEELADARNYLVWMAAQLAGSDDRGELAGLINEALGGALASTVLAFDRAERVRLLAIEWRLGRA